MSIADWLKFLHVCIFLLIMLLKMQCKRIYNEQSMKQ